MSLTAEQLASCTSSIEPWQNAMTKVPVEGKPMVVFSIPLISREKALNWSQVCANLAETVGTLRRQKNPNWKAVICCQQKPDGIEFDDQIIFLPFAEPVEGKDNKQKRQEIVTYCNSVLLGDAYFFVLDADDYVHPDLVDYAVKRRDPSGYLIDRGFLYDISIGKMAPLRRANQEEIRAQEGYLQLGLIPIRLDYAMRKITGKGFRKQTPRLWKMRSFDSSCGSCVAWRYRCGHKCSDPIGIPDFNHRWIRLVIEAGLITLNPVPFSAMIYVVGHGENLQKVKGRLHLKSRYISEFELPSQETKQILTSFGVG